MSKYLVKASYTQEGLKGLLKDGGTKRRATVEQAVQGMGGKLEAFYFAFGETDVYAIADMHDNITAAAISIAVTASGTVWATAIVLITPEEMDQVVKKTISYRPPGT